MTALPAPSPDALKHQQKLLRLLDKMIESKGPISFAEFMAIALYAPGLGYYSAGSQKFGASGDFVTAPEISVLFSRCLGRQCFEILTQLGGDASILELGAGSGKMAGDLLLTLKEFQRLPVLYYILEVSADLRQRQYAHLKKLLPDYIDNIIWLDKLPEKPFKGIILGNEVIDAMPVEIFRVGEENQILEAKVSHENDAWQWHFVESQRPALIEAVAQLQTQLAYQFPAGYTSEINLGLAPWCQSISDVLAQGVMLFIDYGFSRHEYYHPSRHMGTLMCHYRHHAHPDPFRFIGLQDITAHVDFTALALASHQAGCQVRGFTTQAAFLLANGLLDEISNDAQTQIKLSQQIQTLTGAHEMGELFKVMALSKDFDFPLQGFALRDFRHRL